MAKPTRDDLELLSTNQLAYRLSEAEGREEERTEYYDYTRPDLLDLNEKLKG